MKTRLKPLIFLLGSATFLVVSTRGALAQEDPPSRVGRLSYVQGQVSFEPAGVEQWAPAELNRPLSTGDRLWADSDGRAVIQLGSAAIHLNSQTSFSFLNLNGHTVQIRLTEGDLNLRVRHLDGDGAFEIDTPNAAVSILRTGEYRLQVQPDGNSTIVIVRNGEAELTGGGQSLAIRKHQLLQVAGTDSLATNWGHAPDRDGFDRFCESRMHREERSASARYVSRDMVGYDDLDDNGSWRDAPGYGHAWFPRVTAAGWAPYHDGHWAWVDPWGWNWVDEESWGFAPFHYGRWASIGGNWGWVPGPTGEEPVYAPALVSFVGAGDGVGWFPLGPGEVYTPGYAASEGYWNQVNRSNTTIDKSVNITKIYNNNSVNNSNNTNNSINHSNVGNQRYANQTVPGAVTAVPRTAFASGQPVAKSAVAVTPHQAAVAQLLSGPAVAPTMQALLPPGGGAQVAHPSASAVDRVVRTKQPPPAPPVPFAQQQQALAANPGRPLTPAMLESFRHGQPAQRALAPPMAPPGPNSKPAPSEAASAASHLNPPASVQPNVALRVNNPDRPYSPASVQPNVAPRVNNPGRPYSPASVQPNAAPRVNNPDRPYPPASVQPNAAPRVNNPGRTNPPASVQPNVTARASNPPRPIQPSGRQPANVARPVSKSTPPNPPAHAAPRVNNPTPAAHAQTHTAPPPPRQDKKDEKPKR